MRLPAFRSDGHFCKFLDLLLQFEVIGLVLIQVDRQFLQFISYIGDFKMVESRGKAQRIKSVNIGDRSPVQFLHHYGCTDKILTCPCIPDVAADGIAWTRFFFFTIRHQW